MEVVNEKEVERQMEIFQRTFSETEEDQAKAKAVVQVIVRQLNDTTLRGYINYEFEDIVMRGFDCLFDITFLEQMKFPEDCKTEEELKQYSRHIEVMRAGTICKSSFNLYYMLATRVQEGRDYNLIGREIDSKKPLMISQK